MSSINFRPILLALGILLFPLADYLQGQTATTTVAVGMLPHAAVVNPVTNKIYVVSQNCVTLPGSPPCGTGSVTVIDGATNMTATVPVGNGPFSLALNSVTNKIYVVNRNCTTAPVSCGSGSVTVIDGATNSTTTVPAGLEPLSLTVNPVTNKIYVANFRSNTVMVIDGVTNATTTVPVGPGPGSLAVNPLTNKIYVANENCSETGSSPCGPAGRWGHEHHDHGAYTCEREPSFRGGESSNQPYLHCQCGQRSRWERDCD